MQKAKVTDYEAQVQEMEKSLKSRENVLHSGEKRLGMTKRIHKCKCELRVCYDMAHKHWKAKVTCAHHTDHCDIELPPPPNLPTSVIDVLQKLRKDTGATVAQQLKFCSAHGFDVTPSFLRRLNNSVGADPTFGLSGDGGFLFTLLSLKDQLNFCIEFELTDNAKKVQQNVTVACAGGTFVHVQGGRANDADTTNSTSYNGLDSRDSDNELQDFYTFLKRYLIRAPGLSVRIRNCVYVMHQDLRFLAAYPNVLMFDTTNKTNIRNMHFGYGSGLSTNHNWFKGFSFVLESLQKRDFFWLWSVGTVALIPESIRVKLQMVVTDGDDNMTDGIEGAFQRQDWGVPNVVSRRRCIFHLFNLNFEKDYPQHTSDEGVGMQVRDWIKQAGQKCQTKSEMMDAGEKLITYIREKKATGGFTENARETLINWVTARLMQSDLWCRYNFRHLQCFDIETTSPSEGSHSALKSDPLVNSHCELSILLLADMHRTKKLYKEIERESCERALQAATNVTTSFETFMYRNFCLHTCECMVREFIASKIYTVYRPRPDDDPSVVALVHSVPKEGTAFAPFKFSRIHVIRKIAGKLGCSCAAGCVHGRPCRHLLNYNKGLVDASDFAHFHTTKYQTKPYTAAAFAGVADRRPETDELPELPREFDNEDDVCGGGGDDCGDESAAQHPAARKKRASRPYTTCEQEMKRVLVKWGNHPQILEGFFSLIRERDNELGDVSEYRYGRGSSKATPQASRAYKSRK